jgi:YfiH family protein
MTVDWISAQWPAPETVVAGTTTRAGGVSRKVFASLNLAAHVGDDPLAVNENRHRFVSGCGLPSQPHWLSQVHGTEVVRGPGGHATIEADAVIANQANVVCAVLTADCLPVLFTTEDGSEVAAAHAGWRGLSDGILENTVAAIQADADRILAWFGPAISKPAFEVGDEVRERFLANGADASACFSKNDRGRWQADLYAIARTRLEACGVCRIFGGGFCTHADGDRFFSYRRDGPCGRMATFIFRRELA